MTNRSSLAALALLGCLVVSGTALADAPAWTFVEAGYNNVDLDDVNDDGDGWFAGASIEVGKSWHLFGRFMDSETDDMNLDVSRWFAGAGWHGLLGERADVVGEVAYSDAEFGPVDDSGYFGRAGIRFRPIQLLEVGAFARYEDLGDLDDDIVWQANALIYVWRLGIGLEYETQDEIDTYNAFVRFNFSSK